MVCQIQKFLSEGCSYREIAKRMGVGRNTIAKYREGDPEELSMYGIRQSKLDIFYDFIIQCLDSGWSKSKTIKEIYTKGYTGSKSNVFDYLCKIEQKENRYFEVQPYIQTMTEALKYRTGSIGKEKDYITREGIFRYALHGCIQNQHSLLMPISSEFSVFPYLYDTFHSKSYYLLRSWCLF